MSAPDSTSRLCGHPRTRGRGPCKHAAGARTEHLGWGRCWLHAGNSPTGIKFAARLKAQAGQTEIRAGFYGMGGQLPVVSPERVLLDEVSRSAAIVRYLEGFIGSWDLSEASPNLGDVLAAEGIPRLSNVVYFDKGGVVTDTEAHAWLRVFREERTMARQAAKMALDAGIEERVVRLAEQQADLFADAIRAFLVAAAIELTPERIEILGGVLRGLRAGQGGAATAT